MPIAAPLLVPFAELVGITTAGLALSQISDAVQSYMKSNPEQSMKILTMLSPELGIASMMKKKTKKPEVEIEVEDEEEKLTAKEKNEKFKELAKTPGRGRQDFINLAKKLGLTKKGSEEQPPEDDEEEKILTGAQKTQLFKNLFKEGGERMDYARLGRATKRGNQGLYQEGLEALKKTLKGKKDGGRIGYAIGGEVEDFYETIAQRQNRLQNPSPFTAKINNIIGDYLPVQRSVPQMLASGVVDERLTSGIPFGISGLLAKALPDKYYDQTLGQQAFTQSQMGYTGPTVFGENTTGNYKDPFGYNVRSAFGNYSDFVQERLGKLEDIVEDQLTRGLTDTLQMKELTFRQKQNMDRQNLISDAAKIQELKRQEEIKAAAAREIANQAAIASTRNAFTDTGNSVGRSSDPGTAAAGMGGGSRQATSAGSTKSGRTDGGWGWADGGRVGYQAGGVATPEQYAAALGKVSAGTQDQQNRSLAEYVQNSLGLTQKHFDTVNQMKQNPSQFGINSQFDYAKKSGADLVKNANPFAQPFVALGQGVASPIYDYGQALKKYSDKGYQGEFGLSTQGILDFGKNLLRVGQEFAAQKPIQMALGRTLGGAEAIREGISNLFTNPSQQATTSSNPQIQQTTQNTSQTNYGSPGSIYTDSGNTYYVGKDGLPYNVTGINLENFKVQGENPDGSWYTKYNIPSSVYGLANGGLATMFSEKR